MILYKRFQLRGLWFSWKLWKFKVNIYCSEISDLIRFIQIKNYLGFRVRPGNIYRLIMISVWFSKGKFYNGFLL